jgi:hypothetical protein
MKVILLSNSCIALTLYPVKGIRGNSDIPPIPRFIKIAVGILQTRQVVSPSPSERSLPQVYVLSILLSPSTTSMDERERCYSFILSRTPHETSHSQMQTFFFAYHESPLDINLIICLLYLDRQK